MVSALSSSGYVTASESGSVNCPGRSGAAVVDDEHPSERDRVIHRYNCPCPITECNVAGGIPFLVSHLSEDHEIPIHRRCSVEHCLKIRNRQEVTDATWILTIMNCFGHYLCLHFEDFVLCGAPVYMVYVRLMGSKEDASGTATEQFDAAWMDWLSGKPISLLLIQVQVTW